MVLYSLAELKEMQPHALRVRIGRAVADCAPDDKLRALLRAAYIAHCQTIGRTFAEKDVAKHIAAVRDAWKCKPDKTPPPVSVPFRKP